MMMFYKVNFYVIDKGEGLFELVHNFVTSGMNFTIKKIQEPGGHCTQIIKSLNYFITSPSSPAHFVTSPHAGIFTGIE